VARAKVPEAEIRRESPPRDRTFSACRQRGTRGCQRGQGRRPVQAPFKASRRETPPATKAVPLTADHGRLTPMVPDLSQCKGSCVLTPEVCLVCFSPLDQWTPCRG
jgi:hypothetical protein